MAEQPEVPPDVVARLASVCLRLPETRQEAAWVGVRWRVRTKTFAHVLMIAAGWPPAYARAAGSDGCVLTFRSRIAELDRGTTPTRRSSARCGGPTSSAW